MTSHTPGPWQYELDRIDEDEGYVYLINDTARTNSIIAFVPDDRPVEQLANTNLIAAAPDLLAVCERLVESASYWSEYDVPLGIVDDLRAVIAKAKGEAS